MSRSAFSTWSAPRSCSPFRAQSRNGWWRAIRSARCCSPARRSRSSPARSSSCRKPGLPFRTRRLGHHVLRSVSQGCSQTFLLIAFSLMPLAGATAINFSSPLFATLASALLLKETVGLARWLALLVGFGGVLIVTEPGAGAFQVGALFALANAVLYGSVTAGVRGMTTTESAQTLTLYQLLLLTGFFALLLPLGWTSPTPVDAAWIVFNGVSNAVGQYWWTRALHLAPASAVAPFNYLSLIWASILGFAIWGDVPTVSLVVGSAVVVASGLFLLWRESNARQAKPPANE